MRRVRTEAEPEERLSRTDLIRLAVSNAMRQNYPLQTVRAAKRMHDAPNADAELHADQLALAQFLLPGRRDRFRKLLVSERGRAKLRAQLPHFRDLDPEVCERIPPSRQSVAAIEALLVQRGAPSLCVVVAENVALDGQRMSLHDALSEIVGHGSGALISCIPGMLGYFEGEDAGHRFLLRRAAG